MKRLAKWLSGQSWCPIEDEKAANEFLWYFVVFSALYCFTGLWLQPHFGLELLSGLFIGMQIIAFGSQFLKRDDPQRIKGWRIAQGFYDLVACVLSTLICSLLIWLASLI